jgi:hypothetical protein
VWISVVDPVCITSEQMREIETALKSKNVLMVGPHLPGLYEFNTGAIACLEDFPNYSDGDVKFTEFKHIYLCYNRKPKPHRLDIVKKLIDNELEKYGIITLGLSTDENQQHYGKTNNDLYRTIDDPPQNYTFDGKFNLHTDFGNVPYDVCSLGRLDIWQTHFLNIVSETIAFPWDDVFVTEKTWKPIIGLRPFLINGQTTIYQWLRDRGFKTFNHYFDWVEIENVPEYEVQTSIVEVVKGLSTKTPTELMKMYEDMMPDLTHNRNRFFEFAKEQKDKVYNLFL